PRPPRPPAKPGAFCFLGRAFMPRQSRSACVNNALVPLTQVASHLFSPCNNVSACIPVCMLLYYLFFKAPLGAPFFVPNFQFTQLHHLVSPYLRVAIRDKLPLDTLVITGDQQ